MFRHLNTADLDALAHLTTEFACAPGHIFYRPGDANNSLFFLKEGTVQLYHLSPDGRKLVVAVPQAGECFGQAFLPTQKQRQSFAEAVSPACVYVLARQGLERLLSQRPGVALALLYSLEQRLTQTEAQLVDTTFKSMPARLATLLLQLAHTQPREQGKLVVTGLTHEELAERLGVYRETVSSALRELKDAQAIQLGRRRIVINSPQRLASIAHTELREGGMDDE